MIISMGKIDLPTDKIISCFYDSTTDCVKVLDPNGHLLSFNPHGYEIMEIDNPADVLGKKWLTFWEGEMLPKASEALEKASNGTASSFSGYCPTYRGTPKWWDVHIVPLKNEFDEVQWILSISRDVTEYEKLRLENKKLKKKLSLTTA